jgi:murein DD-endopeptidase MepM/ murein hydrolase activator NlpD
MGRNIVKYLVGLLLAAQVLWACAAAPTTLVVVTSTPQMIVSPTLLAQAAASTPSLLPPTATQPGLVASATSAPSLVWTVTPAPTAQSWRVSSPLQGIALAELPDILTQEFIPPRPGQDDGHFGVDYAYYRRGEQLSILGTPILAVLPGQVAAVLTNRPPFGHAVMVESRLADLPEEWVAALDLPPRPDPLPVVDRVPCDLSSVPALLALPGESIYIIYAHLNLTPTLQMGEAVAAGAVLGEVGNSGYSGNPHLHIEAHIGPAGVAFGSLAFYEVSTSEEERRNYCLWRMSGVFRVFDPRQLWER